MNEGRVLCINHLIAGSDGLLFMVNVLVNSLTYTRVARVIYRAGQK